MHIATSSNDSNERRSAASRKIEIPIARIARAFSRFTGRRGRVGNAPVLYSSREKIPSIDEDERIHGSHPRVDEIAADRACILPRARARARKGKQIPRNRSHTECCASLTSRPRSVRARVSRFAKPRSCSSGEFSGAFVTARHAAAAAADGRPSPPRDSLSLRYTVQEKEGKRNLAPLPPSLPPSLRRMKQRNAKTRYTAGKTCAFGFGFSPTTWRDNSRYCHRQ